MNGVKSYLKRYRLLRNIIRAIKTDISMLRSEGYRLWKSVTRNKPIQKYLDSYKVKKLHIGAGTNILDGWLNTDLRPQSDELVYLDITEPLPFPDRTFDYIFSEHLIEHVPHTKAIYHLQECYRVLKPNGKLRVATPDLQFLITLYNKDPKTDIQKRYIHKIVNGAFPDTGFYHETFAINYFFRGWGHEFIYDNATLQYTLHKAGFKNITRFPIKESDDLHLKNLEHHGSAISEEFNQLQTMAFEGTRLD